MKVYLDEGASGTPDDSSVRALAVKPCALRRTALRLRGIDGSARPSHKRRHAATDTCDTYHAGP